MRQENVNHLDDQKMYIKSKGIHVPIPVVFSGAVLLSILVILQVNANPEIDQAAQRCRVCGEVQFKQAPEQAGGFSLNHRAQVL